MARFGFGVSLRLLSANRDDIDEKHDWGRTPLSYAVENGQEAMVKMEGAIFTIIRIGEAARGDREDTSVVGRRGLGTAKLSTSNI